MIRLDKCDCQNDCHFGDAPPRVKHLYGAEFPEVFVVRTPLALIHVCSDCRDTCMSIYKVHNKGRGK